MKLSKASARALMILFCSFAGSLAHAEPGADMPLPLIEKNSGCAARGFACAKSAAAKNAAMRESFAQLADAYSHACLFMGESGASLDPVLKSGLAAAHSKACAPFRPDPTSAQSMQKLKERIGIAEEALFKAISNPEMLGLDLSGDKNIEGDLMLMERLVENLEAALTGYRESSLAGDGDR